MELEKVSENGGYDNERKQISAASLTRLMMFGSKATSNTINTVQSLLSTPKRFWGGYWSPWGKQDVSKLPHRVFVLADGVCIHLKIHHCLSTRDTLLSEGLMDEPRCHGYGTHKAACLHARALTDSLNATDIRGRQHS